MTTRWRPASQTLALSILLSAGAAGASPLTSTASTFAHPATPAATATASRWQKFKAAFTAVPRAFKTAAANWAERRETRHAIRDMARLNPEGGAAFDRKERALADVAKYSKQLAKERQHQGTAPAKDVRGIQNELLRMGNVSAAGQESSTSGRLVEAQYRLKTAERDLNEALSPRPQFTAKEIAYEENLMRQWGEIHKQAMAIEAQEREDIRLKNFQAEHPGRYQEQQRQKQRQQEKARYKQLAKDGLEQNLPK